jgi:Asp-tRNA(Asn)/Glu-tRNA(Gln) amidotransferase A subunit family amidase
MARSGSPLGMQLVAPLYADRRLLAAADLLHRQLGSSTPLPGLP